MKMIEEIVGNNLRYFRKCRRRSQLDLSLETGLDASHIGRIERGELSVKLSTLEKIAQALQIPLALLICENAQKLYHFERYFTKFWEMLEQIDLEKQIQVLSMINRILCSYLEADQNILGELSMNQAPCITYELTTEEVVIDHQPYIVYGVCVVRNLMQMKHEIHRYPDISCDRDVVTDFVNTLNYNQVSLLHFDEIVEDFCANDYTFIITSFAPEEIKRKLVSDKELPDLLSEELDEPQL